MRYRNQRAVSGFAPGLPAPEDDDQVVAGAGLASVDYELMRRLEAGSSQESYRLHPLASRVQHHPRPQEPQRPDVTVEAGQDSAEESENGGRDPAVTLVSAWSEADEEIDETEYDDEVELIIPEAEVDEPQMDDELEGAGDLPEAGSERMPKVIVVDRAGRLAVELAGVAEAMVPEPEILKLDRPTEVVEIAAEEDPDVIVFSPEEVTGAGLKRLAQIHKAQPRIVILLSDNNKTWSAAQMAASGASDFLPANPSKARLRTKLAAALRTAEQLRVENVVVTERVVVQEAAPAEPQPRPAAPATALARVFTVASASGGSGKTTVATNLATYLVKATGGRVLLIDLDLQFGEAAPSLHLHPKRTIEDLLGDPEVLSETVVEHSCGFKVLCAPSDALIAEQIGPSEVSAILEVARKDFDFIVVDTPPTLNETCLVVFDHSEKVLLTANMDVPSLKNMRRYLETIEKLNVPAGRTELIVNRADSGIGLDIKGVNQLFSQGFLAVLPVAREVTWSTNMGVPILHANPKSEISRQLAEGFSKLVPPVAGEAPAWAPAAGAGRRSGILGRRKGKN